MINPLRSIATAGLIAGSLIAAMPAGATSLPAAASDALASAQARAYPGEGYTQYYGRRGGYGRGGGYYRRGGGGGGGGGVAAGLIGGLAAGALIGGALSAGAAPAPVYGPGPGYGPPVAAYGPQPVGNIYGRDPNWVSYCASRYRSFDPVSGTYLAGDGYRYPCQ